MRLQDWEVATIKSETAKAFGETAVVRLFGSRVHDHLKGGDIDLHVECDPAPAEALRKAENALWGALQDAFDERGVDIIVTQRAARVTPIAEVAYRDGVVL